MTHYVDVDLGWKVRARRGQAKPDGCQQGKQLCGDNCVDTEISLQHCGDCDPPCAASHNADRIGAK